MFRLFKIGSCVYLGRISFAVSAEKKAITNVGAFAYHERYSGASPFVQRSRNAPSFDVITIVKKLRSLFVSMIVAGHLLILDGRGKHFFTPERNALHIIDNEIYQVLFCAGQRVRSWSRNTCCDRW